MRLTTEKTMSAKHHRIVLVTCGSTTEARKIGRALVEKKLADCANIVPGVESIYRWKGNVERAREVLIIIKTMANRLPVLEREVKRLHSYDVPEFIVLSVIAGSRNYLAWLHESTLPTTGC
jgi:periplasmic divalent cation tolerance protein